MKIKIKRLIDLEGSIGLFAAGNSRKLRHCIETYVKENSGMVVNMVSKYNEVRLAKFVVLIQEIESFQGLQSIIKGN